MDVRFCTEQSEWEEIQISQGTAEFLQSWEWGAFQEQVGHRPVRLIITPKSGTPRAWLGFRHLLPFGYSYIYFPRVDDSGMNAPERRTLCHWVSTHVGPTMFLRIEPMGKAHSQDIDMVPVHTRQPQDTLWLSLLPSEDELLDKMHSKTRYNIRLAEKKGVTIEEGKNIDWFWTLNQETTSRDGFKSHDKAYYEAMLSLPICHQLTAIYNGSPVASNLYIAWNGRCTYLHGTSSSLHRNVMAPYVLQWHAILFAKKFGNKIFDFWGIAPTGKDGGGPETTFHTYSWKADHKWTGITRFKTGFGGERHRYPSAYELPVKKMWYRLFNMIKKFV